MISLPLAFTQNVFSLISCLDLPNMIIPNMALESS